jgi:hypothetical protein
MSLAPHTPMVSPRQAGKFRDWLSMGWGWAVGRRVLSGRLSAFGPTAVHVCSERGLQTAGVSS